MDDSYREDFMNYRFLSHYEDVKQYCYFLSKNKWDGDDLIQEVMVKTLKHYREQEHIPSSLLKKMAYHQWIDMIRKRKFEVLEDVEELPKSSSHSDHHTAEYVELLFQKLTPKQATMYVLKEVFLFQSKEIALLLKTTETAVKSILCRAKKRISRVNKEEEFPVPVELEDAEERKLLIDTIQHCVIQQDPEQLIFRIPSIRSLVTEADMTKPSKANTHSISPTLMMAA